MSGLFLEIFIAWRYLRSSNRVSIFNMGARISILFMSLMVFVMVVVISVITGFQEAVHKTLQNSGDHLKVKAQDGRPFYGYKKIFQNIEKDKKLQLLVREKFESISLNVLLESYSQFEGKSLRALPYIPSKDLEKRMHYFPELVHYDQKYIQNFNKGNYVIIGREMARYYDFQVGDKIHLLLPKGGFINKNFDIGQKQFTIAGFYRTGFYQFDTNLIFTSMPTLQRILGLYKKVTEVTLQLKSLDYLSEAEALLDQALPHPRYRYLIQSIQDEQGNFLSALQLEKTLMLVILSLLIATGVAGIWVTVRLLIKSRVRSIGILRSMGISARSLLIIFTVHSLFLGFLATSIGASLGIYTANHLEAIILLIEDILNIFCNLLFSYCPSIELVPTNIYYFDHLPVSTELKTIFGIGLGTLILSALSGYFPAKEAVSLDPVQSIRHE